MLVVFHRAPLGQWRSTYDSHVKSFSKIPGHEVFYLNSAWTSTPRYIRELDWDLVIFHYTFLAHRVYLPGWETHVARVMFLNSQTCRKALIPHDEQVHADLLCWVCREFGVTHVFSPAAQPEWREIYRDIDFDNTKFRTVLTGYIDPATVRKYAKRSRNLDDRPIDVGYRSWSIQPNYGRHGLLKRRIGEVFQEAAPGAGLRPDISSDYRDAFLGENWFEFLLRCKYTIGVEGGTSILDYNGELATKTRAYVNEHPDASFEEVEAACFPGRDGEFHYFLLGPRHLEAVLTRTGQVLVEGTYGGALEAGLHYIPLKEDFGNLRDVLAAMKDDSGRAEMVERAYRDVVESGRWTYEAFARTVLGDCLEGLEVKQRGDSAPRGRMLLLRNRIDTIRLWERIRPLLHPRTGPTSAYEYVRGLAVRVLGEERVWRIMVRLRNVVATLGGRPRMDLGQYKPTAGELYRQQEKARKREKRD